MTYQFCERIGSNFGKFYDEATIDKIDGVQMPVYYTGSDYISLHPNDATCDLSYIRQLRPSEVEYKDLGGNHKHPYSVDYFRFVFWSKKPFNAFGKLQLFSYLLSDLNITTLSVNSNIEQVYAEEVGRGKHIRVKDFGYMAIDFKVKRKLNLCDINNC